MYNFILQTIIMASLAVIIYLFARAIPRVGDPAFAGRDRDYVADLLDRLPLEKADAFVTMALEKLLRKLKVVVLKFDNILTRHLHGLRSEAPGKNLNVGQLFGQPASETKEGGVEKQEKSDTLK
ncbi:MAG: hypothetical protein KGI60_02315 [Patescibacteria group bacterium]|nr:hypothetical protein [Patescibacteria group bacterium]